MKRVNHYLTERQVSRLEAMAERTGLKVAELIRRAVDLLLDRESNFPKESEFHGDS